VKIYKGSRQPGAVGGQTVTVNGVPLKHIVEHSPTGFQWGYGGSGPADLALSILADCIGLDEARKHYQNFKWGFVANFGNEWQMTDEQIKDWLRSYLAVRTKAAAS